ncbi:MAG TPA: ABC transporter permease [Candidatus Acidoferrales bacterium]|nr:ABC transporter permease [Candidatus Acidoferrales bacterium]
MAVQMAWEETWKLAVNSLRANKLRAMLTMLGVIIGSACIVLVVTVALAGKKFIIGQIEAVGSNIVYAQLLTANIDESSALADQITLEDMDAVKRGISQVAAVAGTNDIPMTVVARGQARPVSLVGVTQGFQRIRNLLVLRGRYFDDGDFLESSKVCLLTEHLAQRVFPVDDPIGQAIHVGEMSFTVIGIFRERVQTFGQSEIADDSVLLPFPLIKYYTGESFIRTFYAQADSPQDVDLVTQGVAEILRSRHRAAASYDVRNLTSFLQAARYISLALTIVLLLVALIALVISGIGIMNIMLVSVTERTKEIGIRKAIGARRREILWQFLMEATLISGSGAVVGIAIAVLIPSFITAIVSLLPVPGGISIPISWVSVVLAFLVSCSTGILFGYLPASKAAKLLPVESLHYE